MTKFANFSLAALSLAGGLTVLPALAIAGVENGTYSGTTTGGSTVGFTVIADPNNPGQHLINGYNWGFTDNCPDGSTTSGGWGTGYEAGQGVSMKDGRATIVNGFALAYLSETVHFSGNMVTGKITTVDPALVIPATGKPKKALKCSSKPESFTATLQSSDAVPAVTSKFVGTLPLGQFVTKAH